MKSLAWQRSAFLINRGLIPGLFFLLALQLLAGMHATAAEDKPVKPATVSEAARVIDLSKFPLIEEPENPPVRRIAGLSYQAKGSVKDVFEFQKKKLTAVKFKELPNGYTSDQAASGTFARDGFLVSVTVFDSSMPGAVSITINSHGNVDTAKLPVPKGAKSLYAMPVSAAFVTEAPLDKTAQEVRKLLVAQGWQPYGKAGDSQIFKQNAVRLNARVSSAPAQGGKTVIDYTSELMSADLPAPAEFVDAQYSDSTKQLLFDTKQSLEEVEKFYRETLAKSGWKPTLDHFTKSDFKQFLIFRNPQKDMLSLEAYPVDEILRVTLQHQSEAEVAEIERLAKAEHEKKEAEKEKKAKEKSGMKLSLLLPGGAKDIETEKSRIEFKLASGKGKAAVEELRKKLRKDGWKETEAVLEDVGGTILFNKKDGPMVTILYVDPGLIPAEITISASEIELEVAKPEKE